MRKFLVVLLMVIVVGSIGCTTGDTDDFVFDNLYRNEYFSVCYPSEFLLLVSESNKACSVSFDSIHPDCHLSITALSNESSKLGDTDSVSSYKDRETSTQDTKYYHTLLTIDDIDSVHVRSSRPNFLTSWVYVPLDEWMIVFEIICQNEQMDTMLDVTRTLKISEPIPGDPNDDTIKEIVSVWGKVAEERPEKTSGIIVPTFFTWGEGEETDRYKEWLDETVENIRNSIQVDIPKSWVMLSSKPLDYTLIPLEHAKSDEITEGGYVYLYWDYSMVDENNMRKENNSPYSEVYPRIEILVESNSFISEGDINSVRISNRQYFKGRDYKKRVISNMWACETIDEAGGVFTTRFDIPCNGFYVTIKVFDDETDSPEINQVIDSLTVNPNFAAQHLIPLEAIGGNRRILAKPDWNWYKFKLIKQ